MEMPGSKTFFFLSGLARSGSTLLGAILTQNPRILVTPTSPLLDLLCHTQEAWQKIPQSKAWPDPLQLPNVYSGIVGSIFRHIERPIIIDKHRAWARNIGAATECFGSKPKILCTVRDVTEVLASFLTLTRKARERGAPNFIDHELKQNGLDLSDENLCDLLWNRFISDPYHSLRIGFETDRACLHFIEYSDLVAKPLETLSGIYDFLGLPQFSHQLERIVNPFEERDEFWGLDQLHVIRPELKRASRSAMDVLGPELYSRYASMSLEFWRPREVPARDVRAPEWSASP